MAQKQYRKQGNGCTLLRDGHVEPSHVCGVGEFWNLLRGIIAMFMIFGLLCGSALSQSPGSPDVPKRAVRRPVKKKKRIRPEPKNSPNLVQTVRQRRTVPTNVDRVEKDEPSKQATANSNIELPTTKQAESKAATGATVTAEPREATQGNNLAPIKLTPEMERALGITPSGSAERNNSNDFRFPGLGVDSRLFGTSPTVNPMTLIMDKNKVFVESSQNSTAHSIIIKELGKYPKLEIVATLEEADFIISYTDSHGLDVMPGTTSNPNGVAVPTPVGKSNGVMIVYTLGEKQADGTYQKNVIWSDNEDQDKLWFIVPTGRRPATNLTRHFLKALKRLRGESK